LYDLTKPIHCCRKRDNTIFFGLPVFSSKVKTILQLVGSKVNQEVIEKQARVTGVDAVLPENPLWNRLLLPSPLLGRSLAFTFRPARLFFYAGVAYPVALFTITYYM
jgi:hypothetical protein